MRTFVEYIVDDAGIDGKGIAPKRSTQQPLGPLSPAR